MNTFWGMMQFKGTHYIFANIFLFNCSKSELSIHSTNLIVSLKVGLQQCVYWIFKKER